MSKILNGQNFLSVYATNTEQMSSCCACSNAFSAVICFLFESHLTKVTDNRINVSYCPCNEVTTCNVIHIFCSYGTGGMATHHYYYFFTVNHRIIYTCVSRRKHSVEANI